MIPQAYITEWQRYAPWPDNSMIEQDLVITRALVEIFNHPALADNLAFRGGTALYKLHLPAVRYSEDIDLVQVEAGPIGSLMDGVRDALSPWLGVPAWKQTRGRVTFKYRFISEDGVPLNLKVEINSREHFSVYGFSKRPLFLESSWHSGESEILTYELEELLATKFRALYQRKKGRDLFDLWHALSSGSGKTDTNRIVHAFQKYMNHSGQFVTRAMFEQNMYQKFLDPQFAKDIHPLLKPDISWDYNQAYKYVMDNLIAGLPGEPWKGEHE
ncbi:MAG: nucleotidyl transferase AbiEii/AbiGii toxin family protein [Desulfonatronovibrio sp.]